MYLCLAVTIAHTGYDLMIAIDNVNTVCKIGMVIRLYYLFCLMTRLTVNIFSVINVDLSICIIVYC